MRMFEWIINVLTRNPLNKQTFSFLSNPSNCLKTTNILINMSKVIVFFDEQEAPCMVFWPWICIHFLLPAQLLLLPFGKNVIQLPRTPPLVVLHCIWVNIRPRAWRENLTLTYTHSTFPVPCIRVWFCPPHFLARHLLLICPNTYIHGLCDEKGSWASGPTLCLYVCVLSITTMPLAVWGKRLRRRPYLCAASSLSLHPSMLVVNSRRVGWHLCAPKPHVQSGSLFLCRSCAHIADFWHKVLVVATHTNSRLLYHCRPIWLLLVDLHSVPWRTNVARCGFIRLYISINGAIPRKGPAIFRYVDQWLILWV